MFVDIKYLYSFSNWLRSYAYIYMNLYTHSYAFKYTIEWRCGGLSGWEGFIYIYMFIDMKYSHSFSNWLGSYTYIYMNLYTHLYAFKHTIEWRCGCILWGEGFIYVYIFIDMKYSHSFSNWLRSYTYIYMNLYTPLLTKNPFKYTIEWRYGGLSGWEGSRDRG
jgi:hypothetical protein